MRFAVGPTIVARKQALEAIGGFDRLKDYLAEDFVMGKFAAEAGLRRDPFALRHRASHRQPGVARQRGAPAALGAQHAPFAPGGLRRPAVHPSVAAWRCLAWALHPAWWPLLLAAAGLRGLAAWATARVDSRVATSLASADPAGFSQLLLLAGGLLRQHRGVARPTVLSLSGRPIRTALNWCRWVRLKPS